MITLPPELAEPIVDVAQQVNAAPEWLASLIGFESNFNPQAKNPVSSARGLIQFVDATSRELGYADSVDLVRQHPTYMSQMYGPVLQYLRRYSPYDSEQSLYMAVFYPAARSWPPDKQFPEWVIKANPGIWSPGDYVNLVRDFETDILKTAGPLSVAVVKTADRLWFGIKIAAVVLGGVWLLKQFS